MDWRAGSEGWDHSPLLSSLLFLSVVYYFFVVLVVTFFRLDHQPLREFSGNGNAKISSHRERYLILLASYVIVFWLDVCFGLYWDCGMYCLILLPCL